jgi:hypothetical protein
MDEELHSPFLEKPVACPACGTGSPQRTFRSRLFAPEGKESDQHVTGYRWLAEDVRRVHPPFYFVTFCPKCRFADIAEDFADPLNNPFHRRVTKSFRTAGQREDVVVELLANAIRTDDLDFRSALNLHLLAVYEQLLPSEESRDNYKVARLLLRIAWLYRENAPDASGGVSIPAVEETLGRLKDFEQALRQAKTRWDLLAGALRRRATDVAPACAAAGATNPYGSHEANAARQIEALTGELFRMKKTCAADRAGRLPEGAAATGEACPNSPSYEAFFEKLKAIWPLAPADEPEALRAAVAYFERSVSTDTRFDDPQKHFSIIALMAELLVRCDDLDGAFAMVRTIYKTASDNRQRIMKEMRAKKDPDDLASRRLGAQLEHIAATIAQVRELRGTLLDKLLARDLPKIRGILAQMERRKTDAKETERALEESGIEHALVQRLKEEGGLLEVFGKKKRRFF